MYWINFHSFRQGPIEMPRTMDSNTKCYHPVSLNQFLWFSLWELSLEECSCVPTSLSSELLSVLVKRHRISIRACRPVAMLWIYIQDLREQKVLQGEWWDQSPTLSLRTCPRGQQCSEGRRRNIRQKSRLDHLFFWEALMWVVLDSGWCLYFLTTWHF